MPKTQPRANGTRKPPRPSRPKPVSAKQRRTANLIVSQGISATDAVRDTYNLRGTSETNRRAVITLADNSTLLAQVDAERAVLALSSTRDSASERAAITEKLRTYAIGEESGRDAISLKAIDMYARIPCIDLYREHGALAEEQVTSAGLAESITSTLMALLVQPAAGDHVVEITCVDNSNVINDTTLTVDNVCDVEHVRKPED